MMNLSFNALGPNKISKRVRYTIFRRFYSSTRYFEDLVLTDSFKEIGPYLPTALESLGIPFAFKVSARKLDNEYTQKFLKKALSERRTEYRVSKDYGASGNSLKRQVDDLENMQKSYAAEGAALLDVTFTLRVFAEHPAELNDRIMRIKHVLSLLGLAVAEKKASAKNLVAFAGIDTDFRQKYLLNSKALAHILPVFRESSRDTEGVVLGVDDVSERFVYYSPFSQSSYNMLVVGETGSGKSFFTKLYVLRLFKSNYLNQAVIFDPLNEYACKMFGERCCELPMDSFCSSNAEKQPFDFSENSRQSNGDQATVFIVKPTAENLVNSKKIAKFLEMLNQFMMNSNSLRKMFIIDECHLILRDSGNAELLGTMVRHSRHYDTSIMNISQNSDDFTGQKVASISYNSNRIFVFRTRNLNESQKKMLKLDGFEYEPPERLMGGKSYPYSECIASDGLYCRKLRIFSTEDEEKLIDGFTSGNLPS